MPTPKKGPRLGGGPAHQKAMLANLATGLFEHGAITTTEAKARVLRPYAERLITKAKRGDLHNRRQVLSVIRDKNVVHTLFTEIGPRFSERPGGYTRITKLGPRQGDNAPMAVIELVEEEYVPQARTTKSAPAAAPVQPDESTDEAAVQDSDVEAAEAEDEATADAPADESAVDDVAAEEARTEEAEATESAADSDESAK